MSAVRGSGRKPIDGAVSKNLVRQDKRVSFPAGECYNEMEDKKQIQI